MEGSRMKMDKEIYNELRTRIDEFVAKIGLEKIHAHYRHLRTDDRVRDIDTRFRWDIFSAIDGIGDARISKKCYDNDMHDTHIDTALRKIFSSERTHFHPDHRQYI
jgi:hypothetical protein